MSETWTSNSRVIFGYDETERLLVVQVEEQNCLPEEEVWRLWEVSRSYAFSHPQQPRLRFEVAGEQFEAGAGVALIEPGNTARVEQRCLELLAQRNSYTPNFAVESWNWA
jgi:hypothetical protein